MYADKYLEGGKGGISFGLEIVCFLFEILAAVFMSLDLAQQHRTEKINFSKLVNRLSNQTSFGLSNRRSLN